MNRTDFMTHLTRYIFGFGAALLLSVGSYLLVTEQVFATPLLAMVAILVLAALQLVVQLYCFLHLHGSRRSRDRTISFAFTMVMVLVIVIGSLWIMRNLDYRMGMSGDAMNEYMKKQNEKGF